MDYQKFDGNMYVSLFLPSLEVGTYGAELKRETQQEALKLTGLYGKSDEEGKTRLAFAEVVSTACLVSEINLLGIQAEKELAKTYGKLKRG